MICVLTAAAVRAAEKHTENKGVAEILLRMNAALAVADRVYERACKNGVRTAVFCGPGGNGYDGLLAACRLRRMGCDITVYYVGELDKFDRTAVAYAKNEGLKPIDAAEYIGGADIIVDAVFGIGLSRDVTGETAALLNRLNSENNAFKLAVDIPSGLNADSGEILGICFRADVTVTFSCYKPGMLFDRGRDVCGRIFVADVGVETSSAVRVFEDGDLEPYVRKRSAHKGTSGKVFIIGGCGNMIGAPMLAAASAHAAYLNGAGTVTVCLPSVHRASAASRVSMAMMKFLPDTADGFIKFDKKALDGIIGKASAIGIGVGMGETPELKKTVEYLCENFKGTLVLDADALNAIKRDFGFLSSAVAKTVITPHVGEFERLTGLPATVDNAMRTARETGSIVVLKSATTIVTNGTEVRLNLSGTPAMAKGGMGDVLCGCITALSCAFDPFDAASIACYRNGSGAERAVSSYAEMMLTAKDVLKFADYDEI